MIFMQRKSACYKWVLIATGIFNIVANYFDAKKSVRCSRLLVVTELVASGTKCTSIRVNKGNYKLLSDLLNRTWFFS